MIKSNLTESLDKYALIQPTRFSTWPSSGFLKKTSHNYKEHLTKKAKKPDFN